jgi:hypothetical protein
MVTCEPHIASGTKSIKPESGKRNVHPSLPLRILGDIYLRVARLGVSPVVAGGLAVSYWGHPRSTQDIDLAVLVADAASFEAGLRQAKLFPAKGGRLIDLPQAPLHRYCHSIVQAI